MDEVRKQPLDQDLIDGLPPEVQKYIQLQQEIIQNQSNQLLEMAHLQAKLSALKSPVSSFDADGSPPSLVLNSNGAIAERKENPTVTPPTPYVINFEGVKQVWQRVTNRPWATLQRYGWWGFALFCTLLGYMLVWQRGAYMDEIAHKFNVTALAKKGISFWDYFTQVSLAIPARLLADLSTLTTSQMLPENELLLRCISTAAVASASFLLGLLAYRLLNSATAGLLTGLLCLMPIFAQEAVLWGSSTWNMVGMVIVTVFMHCLWNALTKPVKYRKWTYGAVAAAFTASFLGESLAVGIGIFPFFALLIAYQKGISPFKSLLKRLLIVGGIPLFVMLLSYYLFYVANSGMGNSRGGLDLGGALGRIPAFVEGLNWLTTGAFGQEMLKDTFVNGLTVIFQSWKGLLLLIGSVLFLIVMTVSWRSKPTEYEMHYRVGFLVITFGLIWAFLNLLLPGILLKGQILEIRMLLFPAMGLSLAVGTLVWLIIKLFKRPGLANWFVAIIGSLLLLSSISMAGFAQAYALRSQLNQRQLDALVKAIPANELPQKTYFVPFILDERLYPQKSPANTVTETSITSKVLIGLFETALTTRSVFRNILGREDLIEVTSNRWVGRTITATSNPQELNIQGTLVSLDRTLLFTYWYDKVIPIESVTLVNTDGSEQTFQLPVAKNLAQKGSVTFKNIKVANGKPTYRLNTPELT